MLPFVGIVAIGLLVVAGKLFFVSGVRSERSPVPQARERPVAESEPTGDVVSSSAQGAAPSPPREGTEPLSSPPSTPTASPDEAFDGKLPSLRRTSLAIDVLAIPYGSAAPDGGGTKGAASGKEAEAPKSNAKRVAVVVSPSKKTPAQPSKAPVASPPAVRKAAPTPAKREAPASVPPKQTPKAKAPSWQVQVGAFSAKESAVEVSRKLTQSGYKVAILSGVRFHRVMVQAGPTRQDAVALASRLEKDGFPGAFSVPPVSP